MKGSRPATVNAGETAKVTIPLAPDDGSIARTFLIHFTSNKAFVEPCMRKVLQQAMAFAKDNKDDKLIIVGHTDKVDTDEYNQSLSERRARSVYAFLTFGRDPAASLREWQELRKARPKSETKTVKDSWGLRQARYMLQDLGFYPGNVNDKNGKNDKERPLTDEAVRAFRCKAGLPPGQDLDDPTLDALSKAYMAQDGFALPASRFLPNCSKDDVLKWLGCGEQDPVKNVATAWRPNRRVELMFVKAAKLPCDVPPPDTLEMVPDGAGSAKWCLPKGPPANRTCFVFPALPKKGAKPAPGQFVRQPVESGTLDVTGTILRQARNKDGTTVINDDGTVKLEPVPGGQAFFAIAADGEIQVAENPANGEPVPTRTGAKGEFKFTGKRTGVYHLEAVGPVLARLAEEGDGAVKGNAVCKRLAAGDKLDVVLINAPVIREIRLPVAVHLLTALDPATRRPRPSQLPGNETLEEAATLDEDGTRELFDGGAGAALTVNFIWRQARIRFEVKDVVREVFATPGKSGGSVDGDEMEQLRRECSAPNVVNVFLTLSLLTKGRGDGGATVSPESARAQGLKSDGSFVAQRIRGTLLEIPVSPELGRSKLVEVLAHELGHFVLGDLTNADHADENDPANKGRLMLPSSAIGTNVNIRLIQDEVDRSRSKRAASFACVPLTLEVKGAVQAGGKLSHRFFAVQAASQASDVEVTAQISAELAALGTVEVECATAQVIGRQCFVNATQTGVHEIKATYTPAITGGEVVTTRVVVHIVKFTLRVEGNDARPLQPGSSTFVTVRTPGRAVFVVAQIDPKPFCVPRDLVQWTNGLEQSDPLRRAVIRGRVAATRVTAKIGDAVRFVDIVVVETALATDKAPFDKATERVSIEGVLSTDLNRFGIGRLFDGQPDSVFRVRADVPDVQGAPAARTLQAKLASLASDGTVIETLDVTLDRGTGDRFVSRPLLAIPDAIPRADIRFEAPQSLEVLRSHAEGKVRLTIAGLESLDPREVTVEGRVFELCTVTIQGAAPNPKRDLDVANRVWAQFGIEVRAFPLAPVDRPDLLVLKNPTQSGNDPKVVALYDLGRDTCASDIIGYYVQKSEPFTLGRRVIVPAQGGKPGRDGFYEVDQGTQYTFGHEIGHVLGLDHDTQDIKNLMAETPINLLPNDPKDRPLRADQFELVRFNGNLRIKP